jgi:hypothetical protein
MRDLPIIKNIHAKPFITIKQAREVIEHLSLMIAIEEQREMESQKGVLHIL